MDEILNCLQKAEESAEDILKCKQEIIDLNVKINKNREAINGIKNHMKYKNESDKLWLCFGNSFVKTRISCAKSLINRDQNDLNKRIDELRNDLKPKVDQLRQSEGKEELKGFDLKPMSRQELTALNTILES